MRIIYFYLEIILNPDDIRQERPNEDPIFNLNKKNLIGSL